MKPTDIVEERPTVSYRSTRAFERQPTSLPFVIEWKRKAPLGESLSDEWSVMAMLDGSLLAEWLVMKLEKSWPFHYRLRP